MKLAALVAAFSVSIPLAADARAGMQSAPARGQRPAPTAAASDKVAEAYVQFLLGHRFEENEDETSAIAAYKRAMELDPRAAEIPAQLAGLYLKQSKAQEAIATAEIALKIAPANREANRVLGMVYAALSDSSQDPAARRRGSEQEDEANVAKAIQHFEAAIDGAVAESDPNVRATLARLYVRSEAFEKAIPLLTDLINQEAGWQDGPLMLVEAYAGAGRSREAIAWLEERTSGDPRLLPALADFYERERRWSDAAGAYARALQRAPRGNPDLKVRYASALMNAGGRENIEKARTQLIDVTTARPTDIRSLYLLSQAQRRLGDAAAAEASARRVIAQNNQSPWGYYALAESLEARREYQSVVDELAPVVAANRAKAADGFDVGLLLPHLGFAYQEIGQPDKAIASFEEARALSPDDPSIAGYLIDANISAKRYDAAVAAAKSALAQNPNDLRLTRLEAQALRQAGKPEQGIALLQEAVTHHADDPAAYITLAQAYNEADQSAQAVKVLQDAQGKFPKDDGIAFELGTVFDKQKRFAEAESSFRQVLARDPENAIALNYLGYMLAERGERLDESVGYLTKALQIEPENPSYLDSLGWAYFKADKFDLAETNLRRAADQLKTNSVIQEHFGQVLFKLGRYDEAIAAWNRALAGDGDSIDKADVDRKILAAKQKLKK